METALTTQQTENSTLNVLNDYPAAPAQKSRSLIKASADYALTAVEKVLKMNILGADINTEYLELTLRVYAGVFMLSAKEYMNQLSRKTVLDKNILAGLVNRLPGYNTLKHVA